MNFKIELDYGSHLLLLYQLRGFNDSPLKIVIITFTNVMITIIIAIWVMTIQIWGERRLDHKTCCIQGLIDSVDTFFIRFRHWLRDKAAR